MGYVGSSSNMPPISSYSISTSLKKSINKQFTDLTDRFVDLLIGWVDRLIDFDRSIIRLFDFAY